jgi:hypothetical protein
LLPLNQHVLGVIGDVGYHSCEGAATRLDEGERILTDLGNRRILVSRNHGLLTVGRSVGEAFVATYKMERACQMQLAFQQSSAEFFPIPEPVEEVPEFVNRVITAVGSWMVYKTSRGRDRLTLRLFSQTSCKLYHFRAQRSPWLQPIAMNRCVPHLGRFIN